MKTLLAPANSWLLVSLAIFSLYVALPAFIYFYIDHNQYMLLLAGVSGVGLAAIIAGYHLPLIDRLIYRQRYRRPINARIVHVTIWMAFTIFVAVTLLTADSVPVLSALGSSTADQLSQERAGFLKLRTGWEAALPYFSTVFVGVLLPYSTTRLFAERSAFRFLALAVFIAYTLLSLEKILFILAVAPLTVFVTQYYRDARRIFAALAAIAVLSAGVLYLNTVLASGTDYFVQEDHEATELGELGDEEGETARHTGAASYFDIRHRPDSAVKLILWRSIAVPVITAADGLRVFEEQFEGRHLLGATSSLVARVTGQQRVNFDAVVFGDQFGSAATGRANAVFFIEAFINFGWVGVIIFSLIVGQALRLFARSDDLAFQCMWVVFCWFIFTGGLFGTMFSNGFLLMFIAMLTINALPRVESEAATESATPSAA
ncbi:hypothetical protein [Devosia sp. Root685]|uniref:hypothetical protein n=1 Tax=Devosia sp. Root685 TaxID=1736587 RepID=UPI000A92943D|nr:hypothetical protein [Devosia sp. Root685]